MYLIMNLNLFCDGVARNKYLVKTILSNISHISNFPSNCPYKSILGKKIDGFDMIEV